MAYEEAKYTVIEKDGDFELRQFEPRIVAETIVEGEFDEVGSEGFRRLFKYISGNNRIKQTIPVTAPVTREMKSEKLPMTAPVTQEKAGDKWRIAFLMPSKFTLETLPEPLDPGIELKEIPGSLMAVLVYSGTWSRARYEEKRAELEKLIGKRNLIITGEAVFARYNPPFTLWFLRRNEVLIPVGQIQK